MDVKSIIKNRRIELGLTMKDVADYVGVSEATVSRWESGDIENMKRSRIYSLSKILNISPLLIMGIEDDITPTVGRDAHIAPLTPPPSITPAEEELLASYRAAPQTIRDIVDTALAPYANKNPAAERGEAM